MTTKQMKNGRATERGNVLFLILIAVALFAALSYAVTQSSRSGGGDANSEKNLVNSSQITQYPAGVRTSIVRMIIGGVGVDEILFDDPSNFTTALTTTQLQSQAVFYPTGGGATYQYAPPDVINDSDATAGLVSPQMKGQWIFSSKYQVKNIGITTGDNSGNDIIAFLPYVTKSLCLKLDVQLGIVLSTASDAPVGDITAMPALADNMDKAHAGIASGVAATIGTAHTEFVGQPFGCMRVGAAGPYLYYHVLVER